MSTLLLLAACGSVLDEPAADPPIRPTPRATGAVALARGDLPVTLKLPPSSRPGGAPAGADIELVAPFAHHASRKKAEVYATPLPVGADLLPTPTGGTHQFGSTAPPGFEVIGPDGPLWFEQGARRPGTWGFDREHLLVGVEAGQPPPDATRYRVRFAKAVAFEDGLNLATSGQAPEVFVRRTITTGGVSHAGLFLPAPAEATFRVTVPERGRLAFEAAVVEPAITHATKSDGATVIARVGADEVGRISAARGEFQPARFDLSRFAGQQVELTLATEPGADPAWDYVLLESPTLYTPDDDPERILMVFVDTLRHDRLGFAGYQARPTSPHLDRWAGHAAVFENARTVAPWTLPSAYAALSGRQPEDWPAAETLAEALGEAGWRTEAVVTNAFLSQPFGVQRGWDRYRYEYRLDPPDVVARGLDVIDEHPDRDLLLMVHFMGPHLPYAEPWYYRTWSGWRRPSALEELGRGWLSRLDRDAPGFDEIRDYVSDRYDQNVRWVDDAVAPLIERMGGRATVVLFADHGEELWEHDSFEHGHAFWDELLRVPLAVKSPYLPAGRFQAPVSLLDVTPTLLEVAGLPPGEGPGRSLVPVAWGDEGALRALAERPQAFGRPLYGDDGWGVLAGDEKWFDRGGGQHLFALGADPGETRDLAGEQALDRFPRAMGDALGREAVRVWRVALTTTTWPFPVEVTISHPGGLAGVWSGYDPRGRAAGTRPQLVDGRVTMRIEPDAAAPETLYVLPAGDPLDPRGLALTIVSRQVMIGGSCTTGPLEPSAAVTPFLAIGDAKFGAAVDLAWVPEPGGTEVSGFHAEMEQQLRELGYLEP